MAAEARAARAAVRALDVAKCPEYPQHPKYMLHTIGIGAAALPGPAGVACDAEKRPWTAATDAAPSPPPVAIILAGFAGALDGALSVGDIVIDGPSGPETDAAAAARGPAALAVELARALAPRHIVCGRIATATGVVATVANKQLLHKQTGALAVDMEQTVASAYARRLGAMFLAVRAISDAASETLPPDVLGCVNAFGQVRPAALARAVARRPGIIKDLLRLGRNAAAAETALGDALNCILHSGWPTLRSTV